MMRTDTTPNRSCARSVLAKKTRRSKRIALFTGEISKPILQQHRPQELLRRDGRAAAAGVERRELPLHRRQRLVHEQPDCAQRMILAHPFFEIHVAEQRSRSLVRSTQIKLPRISRSNHDGGGETNEFFNNPLKYRTLIRSRSATLNALSALCFPGWSKSEKSDVALAKRLDLALSMIKLQGFAGKTGFSPLQRVLCSMAQRLLEGDLDEESWLLGIERFGFISRLRLQRPTCKRWSKDEER